VTYPSSPLEFQTSKRQFILIVTFATTLSRTSNVCIMLSFYKFHLLVFCLLACVYPGEAARSCETCWPEGPQEHFVVGLDLTLGYGYASREQV
jgi:hypothetical protein